MTIFSRISLWIQAVLSVLFCSFLLATNMYAQGSAIMPKEEFMRAKVIRILQEKMEEAFGLERTSQQVILRITSGEEKGKELPMENGILGNRTDMRLSEGETVILRKMEYEGEEKYLITEKYRLPSLLWLGGFFLVLTFLLGGIVGVRSIFGLAVSILILSLYVVPKIAAGSSLSL